MMAELIKVYVIIELIRVLGNLRVLCLLHEPVMVFRVSVFKHNQRKLTEMRLFAG